MAEHMYAVTIETDEPLGQFFEHSLEEWLETPDDVNDQTPSNVSVEMDEIK